MKFYIKSKPKDTQTRRTIKRFLWLPLASNKINNTVEYRWLEWITVEQSRLYCNSKWHKWRDIKYHFESHKYYPNKLKNK